MISENLHDVRSNRFVKDSITLGARGQDLFSQTLGCAMIFGSTENQWVTSCTNLLHNPNPWQHVCAQLSLAPQ
jgi:hypothetical protein